jgi:hypothetical protein
MFAPLSKIMDRYCIELTHRPPLARDGENVFYLPKKLVLNNAEIAIILSLICNRRLFGRIYDGLMPDHFESMGRQSGVMIGVCVPTKFIIPGVSFPGDIDLLVIPYENEQLIVSETLAIEVKVVRAKFLKQGKAPNEFGFSQAEATLLHGFPYSAVAHVVTSDSSPTETWKEMLQVEIKDADTGQVDGFKKIRVDMLPTSLMNRTFGRLNANCNNAAIGLLSAYISFNSKGLWLPTARPATRNPNQSISTVEGIGNYYQKYFRYFMDTPKYAP